MTKRFAVVYEAEADLVTATALADREICDVIDWLDTEQLQYQRSWQSVNTSGEPLTWKAIKRMARNAGVRSHGRFNGDPGLPDAAAARRAIDYLQETFSDLDAVVLIRDQDDEPTRRDGLEQARNRESGGLVVVVGLAVVEREAWVISGFDPQDEPETARLDGERHTLGFDPRLRSHDLTACKNDQASRSPKRVLRQLSGNDRDRERRCWTEASLELLRERGEGNGLAAFLQEVRERLAALIGYVPPP